MKKRLKHCLWFLSPTLWVIALYLGAAGIALVQTREPGARHLHPHAGMSRDMEVTWRSPDPSLAPEQVVSLQLQGLADRNPTRGTLQCFAFASPGNRLVTGPLPRFAEIISQPPYDQLAKADALIVGRATHSEDSVVRVMVVALHRGRPSTFVWILTRQRGPSFAGCWMTDSVLLLNPPDAAPRAVENSNEV